MNGEAESYTRLWVFRLGNECCGQDIRPYWALWKLCGIVERAPDPVLIYHPLTWSKSESLTFWALMSAPDKGHWSSDVLPSTVKETTLNISKWWYHFFPVRFYFCPNPGWVFFFESLFGTLCSWLSLWSVYCLVKAFVKSQCSFTWGLILLAMTSLIMGNHAGTWLSPSSCIVSRRLPCKLWCFSFWVFRKRKSFRKRAF